MVQDVMSQVLIGVYEPRFLDCSYGFRPGRSCHDVVKIIDNTVMNERVNYVLEADIYRYPIVIGTLGHKTPILSAFFASDCSDNNFA